MKIKKKQAHTSVAMGVLYGCVGSILMTVLLSAALAGLISGQQLQEGYMPMGVMGVLLLASLVGAFIACRAAGRKPMIAAALNGACYFVFLICCTAMFFEGRYQGLWQTALVILGGSLAAALVQFTSLKPVKKGRRAYRFR